MTPPSYEPVTWRCVLPVDRQHRCLGLGFTRPDGSVIRLCLSVEDAEQMMELIEDYLCVYLDGCQSPNSSAKPSSEGSPDVGQSQ